MENLKDFKFLMQLSFSTLLEIATIFSSINYTLGHLLKPVDFAIDFGLQNSIDIDVMYVAGRVDIYKSFFGFVWDFHLKSLRCKAIKH